MRPGAAVVGALTLLLGVAFTGGAPAAAAPEPTAAAAEDLAGLQLTGRDAIDRRLAALDTASATISSDGTLTQAHRAQLLATVSTDRAGLALLRSTLAADTTAAQATAHLDQTVTRFRVYTVVLAQVALVRGADLLTEQTLVALQTAHDGLVDAGADTAALATMQEHIDTALADLDGLADAALAVSPADHDDDPQALSGLRATLAEAIEQAAAALDAGRALQAASPSADSGSAPAEPEGAAPDGGPTGGAGAAPTAGAAPDGGTAPGAGAAPTGSAPSGSVPGTSAGPAAGGGPGEGAAPATGAATGAGATGASAAVAATGGPVVQAARVMGPLAAVGVLL